MNNLCTLKIRDILGEIYSEPMQCDYRLKDSLEVKTTKLWVFKKTNKERETYKEAQL